MLNIYKHSFHNVFVFADIHGQFELLNDKLQQEENIKNSILICAGDCGVGFRPLSYYEKTFTCLNETLININSTLYCIRGNHDNPSFFQEDPFCLSNIKFIQDYSIISVDDMNILCVGGGLSIDRKMRIEQDKQRLNYIKEICGNQANHSLLKTYFPSYWEDELPYYDKEKIDEIRTNGITIHKVITHTSPSFCYKNDNNGLQYWLQRDKELDKDLTIERQQLDNILKKLKEDGHPLDKWVYGHFHGHYEEQIDGIEYVALYNSDYIFDYYLISD